MRSIVVLLLVALAGCGATRGFVYYPYRDAVVTDPPDALSDRELPVVDAWFHAADGTRLHGWFAPYEGSTRALLVCHGNAGNVSTRAGELLALRRATRSHVLLWDYRGFGRSEDVPPREEALYSDAEAALLELERLARVPRQRVVVVGHSLGGAVAVELARRKPGLAGLAVLASFTSIDDVVQGALVVPLGFLVPEAFDSIDKVGAIATPKLFLHGDRDPVIPLEHGVRLHEAAAPPKRLVVIEGADHLVLGGEPGVRSFEELARFVDEVAY